MRLIFGLLLCAAAAAPGLELDSKLPLDPELRITRLENGLTVYVRPNREPENRISLQLAVNAGSILEDDDQRGLAHFLEHMAFNGTEHFEKQELVEFLESIGMEFGADVNAFTSFDETNYLLELPADSPEILEQGLWILHDWARGIRLDAEEIEKERGVVLEEWRLRQGAWQRISDRQMPVLYRGSRYPERLPIGEPEILRSAPREALQRFYRDWYRPELMAVIAVGDFDAAKMESLIHARFSDLPATPKGARERSEFAVGVVDSTLYSIVADAEATRSSIAIQVKLPKRPMQSVGDLRRELVQSLFSGMLNDRYGEIVQRPDPPFIGAGCFIGPLMRSGRQFTLSASVGDGQLLGGLRAALLELERVHRHGFTDGEVERAKAQLLRSAQRAFDERENIPSDRWASELREHFFSGSPSMGGEDYYGLIRELLPGIARGEIEAVAAEVWLPGNRVVTASGPDKTPLPRRDELAAVLAEASSLSVEPYVDASFGKQLLPQQPPDGRIVSESFDAALGLHDWRLSNGIRVLLKPTDFRNDEILMRAFSPGGHSLVADEDFVHAMLSSSFADVGGVGELDAIALGKFLAGKRVSLSLGLSELSETLRGGCSPQDLPLFFELLHASLVAARDDSSAARANQQRLIASLANQSASPERAFADTIGVTMNRHHPRRPLMQPELVESFDYGRAMAILRERFADMGDFQFVFVGSFDVNTLRPLLTRYLASLPELERVDRWRDVGVRLPEGVIHREVFAGQEPKSSVAVIFHGDFPWQERAERYRIGALAQVLQIGLREVLREDLGGTYGVSVNANPSRDPRPDYRLSIRFGCDPNRVDEMLEVLWQSLREFATEGPSRDDVAKVQEQHRREFEEQQRQNGWWLAQIGYRAEYELPFAEILDYLPLVDALTPEDLRAAARRYLPEDRHVQVVLRPATAQ